MKTIDESEIAKLPFVQAEQAYLVPEGGAKPVSESFGPGTTEHTHSGKYEMRRVRIHDARPMADGLDIDECGFRLVRQKTEVADFDDSEEVARLYYPEMESLIQAETGCAHVHIFDHTLRAASEDLRQARRVRGPVRHVHNDYTDWSAPQRVRDIFGDQKAEELLAHRMQIIQVWRGTQEVVESTPLGIIDARSIAPADLIGTERRYPTRTGEIYHLAWNPGHKWFYFPEMRADEAIVFKCYDSIGDVARYTAHCAFDHPDTRPDALPRESIEIRAFAFFAPPE